MQTDLTAALDRLAPEDAPWIHDVEGPDDMPAHVKAMLNGVSLHVPVIGGKLALGTWQGIYLVEHRRRPHSREVIFQFVGSRSIHVAAANVEVALRANRCLLLPVDAAAHYRRHRDGRLRRGGDSRPGRFASRSYGLKG